MNPITEEYRKKLYDDLATVMVDGMQKGELDDAESKKAAQFILDNLDDVETEAELKDFLQELADNWKPYEVVCQNISKELESKKVIKKDEQQIKQIQDKLSQLITSQ